MEQNGPDICIWACSVFCSFGICSDFCHWSFACGYINYTIPEAFIVISWQFYGRQSSGVSYFFRRRYDFLKNLDTKNFPETGLLLFCLAACKVMTFIDWHTWKIIGEAKEKCIFLFWPNIFYYIFEVGLVLLIIMFGQKPRNRTEKRKQDSFWRYYSGIGPGSFSFCFKGVSLEIWNGFPVCCFRFWEESCI